MRRRFLLVPALALRSWAQQISPSATEAEAAVRARVEQFYQLEVDKKYRQAEALLAEDSKDTFYNGTKPGILGFKVDRIELSENNTKAMVYSKVKVTFVMPGFPSVIADSPVTTLWRFEDGMWMQHIDPELFLQTPFGKLQPPPQKPVNLVPPQFRVPDVDTLRTMVKADRDSIILSAAQPAETVTITNGLPGDVELKVAPGGFGGVDAELEKTHLASGEKTELRFHAKDGSHGSGVVLVQISPVGQQLAINVASN